MSSFRARAALTAVTVLSVLGALAGCSSGPAASSHAAGTQAQANTAGMNNPNLDLGSSLGMKPAPDVSLVNQFGQPMSLSQFRGKVVMMSFEDSECTTVCPLTTQSMVEAKQLLGAAGDKVQLLGVDANPDATSVADVLSYSRVHGMVNQWDFLTGSLAQLKATWRAYDIAVQIEAGLIDHTPALYVIDQQGRQRELYLTQMAYSGIGQSAQILADELATLLPGHPHVASQQSLATIPAEGPPDHVTLPSAQSAPGSSASSSSAPGSSASGSSAPGSSAPGTVALGPGQPRLTMFFATWLSEVSDLKSELLDGNAYVAAAKRDGLPALTAVDETVAEPSVQVVRSYLKTLGTPLNYPVGLDTAGRVADGYQVQDQPWFTLTSASGKILWSHDGWLPLPALEAAVKHAASS